MVSERLLNGLNFGRSFFEGVYSAGIIILLIINSVSCIIFFSYIAIHNLDTPLMLLSLSLSKFIVYFLLFWIVSFGVSIMLSNIIKILTRKQEKEIYDALSNIKKKNDIVKRKNK
jgi:hypothetical protein